MAVEDRHQSPATARSLAVGAAAALLIGCTAGTASAEPLVPVTTPTVLAEIPHDPGAYTEGLEFDGPTLYESTGEWGTSGLRQVDPTTGKVLRDVPISPKYFGEGITVVGDRIWELTYRDGVAIEWDRESLTPIREVPFPGEQWGVCLDGDRLIVSDGSAVLRFHDPTTLAELGSVTVTRDGTPMRGIDELECVDGYVWTVVWPTDTIVRIDPRTGLVDRVVDGSGLWPGGPRDIAQILSSIAYSGGGEFLVVGKRWPTMYRVRFDPAA
ncbi:MAG: glutaminyl-peptide cyclotransferase [Mycobacterium sp.]